MNFNKHFQLEGKHALLSASSWRWLYDDEESLIKRIRSQYSTDVGTILHDVACNHIKYQIKMNKYDKKNVMLELLKNGIPGYIIDALDFDSMYENLMTYVNDCVGFRMKPEVVLCYSNNFFGTADAIKFDEKEKFLRIHDYKSGITPAHMEQLLIYAALFCLEYRMKPNDFETELRIYQTNQIMCHNPAPDEITQVIHTIESREKFLTNLNGGV